MVYHLKNSNASAKYLAVAFGRHAVKGHLVRSKVTGTSPTHQITAYNALGEGEFSECEGAFWKGVWIPPADYDFQTGALATAMLSGPQQVNSLFPEDVPHSRTAAIGYEVPVGLGNADIEATPPTDFEGIFKCKKCPDYDEDGEEVDFSYSVNPARVIAELFRTYARIPNLPTAYADWIAYWISRIDWANWTDFRDWHDTTETVNYTTITDFEGFGLTAEFYEGTNFTTLKKKYVQPSINFASSSAAPIPWVAAGNFSARFEGFIKAEYSETYTFHLAADNGVRVYAAAVGAGYGTALIDQWANDGSHTPGTHTATFAMTAGTFYKIKIEWNDGGTTSNLKFEWSSTSQTQEVVPHTALYPLAESKPRYEAHVYFETPTNLADAIRTILFQTNSLMQDVNGKLRFYAYEQLASSFTLDNSNITKFEKCRRRDILQAAPVTALEADFKDLDLLYLEKPATNLRLELGTFTRHSHEVIKTIPLFNTTRWQARKILQMRAKLESAGDLLWEAEGTMSKTYPIIAGDLITATHRKIGEDSRLYLVREAVDKGVAEAARKQGQESEKRIFTLQEWTDDYGER